MNVNGRLLYIDPFSGVAGDMFIGALLDLGLDQAKLHYELAKLQLSGYRLSAKSVMRGAMSGTKFDVEIDASVKTYRNYSDIKKIIADSALSQRVKEQSLNAFAVLAQAEARIHNLPLEQVHFHEVGALDSIVDMVGACIGLELLGVNEVHCGPVALGSGGYVKCDHGLVPVPAPATLEIMKDIPLRKTSIEKELTTPTGAALVKALVKQFGPLPPMRVEKIGYGAGTRVEQPVPNILRVVLGTVEAAESTGDSILEISANIDDATPETLGHLSDLLLSAGVLDVFFTPIQMKKSRPAAMLSVLAEEHQLDVIADLIFRESTSFGLRYQKQSRLKLARKSISVETPFGSVKVKLGEWKGQLVSIHPEYDDCRARAAEKGVALREVIDAAKAAARAAR
ncbi:MAG TPA: nickel pincer cofactor biosynthesis protein LarC [Planctomycetota bacterium]|nr:nickel pincer cofactor biosynthesis protein LarC [Planctomycetota bacterium]